ncbi:MAG: ATP-binding protein [Cyclobacteriaceae bacterium]
MKYKFKVGCSIENLKGVRDFVRTSLANHGISELEISEMVLAMDEMCSNLMIHGHDCNPNEVFELHILIDKDDPVVFEIIDKGNVFDINQFTEPSMDNIIQEKRKGGLGIRLVKSIMDSVEYEQQKNNKCVCRLAKKVSFK